MIEVSDELWLHLTWCSRMLAVAVCLLGLGRFLRRWTLLAAPLAVAGGVSLMFTAAVAVSWLRPTPEPVDRHLFEGVRYERRTRAPPPRDEVKQVSHLLTVDLATPGLRVLVTPGAPTVTNGRRWEIPARTTSGFLRAFDQQLAVNANFYYEQWNKSILLYYPRVGDGVSVVGRAVSNGHSYSSHDASTRTLWFFDRRAEISADERTADHAVSGYPLLIEGEMPVRVAKSTLRHPRTAAGLDPSGRRLFIVVVDGRAPFYSAGATLAEVAGLMRDAGARDAILLDGGGSSTAAYRAADGAVRVLNRPVHGRMPAGYERPVANHLGFSGLKPAK